MSKARVILYSAPWCGHCISFKPEWEKLTEKLKNESISFQHYEEGKDNAEIEQAKVKGYPTIMIDDKEYNGLRTVDAIMAFVKGDNKGSDKMGGKYKQCGGAKQGFSLRAQGGGRAKNDEYYKIKYLKYKAKYMKVRSELGV